MYILIHFCFINFCSLFRRPLSRRHRLSITTKKLYELILCSTTVTPGHGTKVRDTSEDEGNANLDFFLNRERILLTPHVLSIFLFPLRFFFSLRRLWYYDLNQMMGTMKPWYPSIMQRMGCFWTMICLMC